MSHPSDSGVQSKAEREILEGLAARLAIPLSGHTFTLPGGGRVAIDGVGVNKSVLVEVYSHQGKLRGGQFHKVASDALKLITLRRALGLDGARLVLVLGDDAAVASVTTTSWLSEALVAWGVEVLSAEIGEGTRDRLRAAQDRQRMVNPTAPTPDDTPAGDAPLSL